MLHCFDWLHTFFSGRRSSEIIILSCRPGWFMLPWFDWAFYCEQKKFTLAALCFHFMCFRYFFNFSISSDTSCTENIMLSSKPYYWVLFAFSNWLHSKTFLTKVAMKVEEKNHAVLMAFRLLHFKILKKSILKFSLKLYWNIHILH